MKKAGAKSNGCISNGKILITTSEIHVDSNHTNCVVNSRNGDQTLTSLNRIHHNIIP